MKKLFSKIENTFETAQQSFVGKVFNVGKHAVCVEETIAEGKYTELTSLAVITIYLILITYKIRPALTDR